MVSSTISGTCRGWWCRSTSICATKAAELDRLLFLLVLFPSYGRVFSIWLDPVHLQELHPRISYPLWCNPPPFLGPTRVASHQDPDAWLSSSLSLYLIRVWYTQQQSCQESQLSSFTSTFAGCDICNPVRSSSVLPEVSQLMEKHAFALTWHKMGLVFHHPRVPDLSLLKALHSGTWVSVSSGDMVTIEDSVASFFICWSWTIVICMLIICIYSKRTSSKVDKLILTLE